MGWIVRASAGRVAAGAVGVVFLLSILLANVAFAGVFSSVTTPSVTIAPTAAAGARTGYTVVFNTSASGALSQAAGSTVSLNFPAATKLAGLTGTSLTDTTTAKVVGQANSSATLTISFFLYTGAVVNAGDTLSASIQGATNPTTPGTTYKVAVSTSADTTAVNSSPYSIVAGHPISAPTVAIAPTMAAGARTGYTVAFNVSATGAMSQAAGSTLTMTFPASSTVTGLTSSALTDTTTAKLVGQANSTSTLILTFFLYSQAVINPGDHLSATIMGAINPTSPGTTYELSVSTTSDITPVNSASYTTVAGHPITTPSVTIAPTAAVGARTGYTMAFNVSSTGGMSQAVGSSVTITFPADTKVNSLTGTSLTDVTTAKLVGQANPSGTLTVIFFLYSGAIVNPGDQLSASIQGPFNPTTAGTTFKAAVSTSSDTAPVNTGSYSIVAGHAISTPTVVVAPSAAVGARSGYTVAFNVSTTGGMSQAVGSSVTITFAAGTNLSTLTSSSLNDTTTAKLIGQANTSTTTTITYFLYSGAVVNPGDHLSAAAMGVVNPTSPGAADKATVSTSSDTAPVISAAYKIVAGHPISIPMVTPSNHAAAATAVSYTVVFNASATGAMSGPVGSKVNITFPAGTNLSGITSATLTDTSTGLAVGQANTSPTTSLVFILYSTAVVNAGDTLTISFNGAVNPASPSTSDRATVSTTSDITSVGSCPYYIGTGPALPCVVSVTPSSGPQGGGTHVTIVGVNFTGATQVKFGGAPATGVVVSGAGTSITATTPAGTGTVDVTVTAPAGTSPTGPSDKYKYVAPPTITTSSLPGGNVSVAYSATVVATGGKKPFVWSITVGSLPPGLTLNASTGVISGTPTVSGPFSFTIKVTDAEHPAASATTGLSITIT